MTLYIGYIPSSSFLHVGSSASLELVRIKLSAARNNQGNKNVEVIYLGLTKCRGELDHVHFAGMHPVLERSGCVWAWISTATHLTLEFSQSILPI